MPKPRSEIVLPAILLKARKEMFAQNPSILSNLHHRMRLAAMEKTSLRQTFRRRLQEGKERFLQLGFGAQLSLGLRVAASVAAVALLVTALCVGLHQGGGNLLFDAVAFNSETDRAQEIEQGQQLGRIHYALNDVNGQPLSLDQKIDQVAAGVTNFAKEAGKAHYVLSNAGSSLPATYDSVVSF